MGDMDCRLLLGNTYHLAYKPGGDVIEKAGGKNAIKIRLTGLHEFINWPYNILTDSGGF
jgi:queuine tRNA-ribosyltransferase